MSPSGVGPTSKRLGRYHLAEPIGGGPTGEVFRAKVYGVAGFERQFAVKRFHAEFVNDPATAEAIAAAARVYGGLEHPRIARLHEYGVTGGHAFTATELIDGLDLARLLGLLSTHNRSLPQGGIAALLSQIARTVGYAHGRGICHLGLCPTNILVTVDGNAQITDFGFLPARLPKRPADDPSLRSRMPYLAPEQLTSELTSAATDVFQLGAIGYELFMGRAAFTGPDSAHIAEQILSGRMAAADFSDVLPKALVKVLQRCLSRSPFERYPDARALADAIDAATRGLSLAGGLPDIGQAVRDVTQQTTEMINDEASGALSFPLPAPPRGESMMDHLADHVADHVTDHLADHVADHAAADHVTDHATGHGSSQTDDLPATTVHDPLTGRPMSMASAQPVPPVPVGIQSQRSAPIMPSGSFGSGRRLRMQPLDGPVEEMDEEMPTMIRERGKGFVVPTPLGLAAVDKTGTPLDDSPLDNSFDDQPEPSPDVPTFVHSGPETGPEFGPEFGPDLGTELGTELGPELGPELEAGPDPGATIDLRPPTLPRRAATPPPTPGQRSPLLAEPIELSASNLEVVVSDVIELPDDTPMLEVIEVMDVSEVADDAQPYAQPGDAPISLESGPPPSPQSRPSSSSPPEPNGARPPRTGLPQTMSDTPEVRVANTWDPVPPVRRSAPLAYADLAGSVSSFDRAPHQPADDRQVSRQAPGHTQRHTQRQAQRPPGARANRKGMKRVALVVIALAAIGGSYVGYTRFVREQPADDHGPAIISAMDAGVATRAADAAPAEATSDAGTTVAAPDTADASVEPVVNLTATDDGKLTIRSEPKRAKVYLDGSEIGKTPLSIDATADRHKIALVKPGFKLYTADIDGRGALDVTLEDAGSVDGPGGIKVRCSKKNRYYVLIDGVDTGQLCPTERIGVTIGAHTVEIYDPITESRREFPVTVEDTRHSLRVRVD